LTRSDKKNPSSGTKRHAALAAAAVPWTHGCPGLEPAAAIEWNQIQNTSIYIILYNHIKISIVIYSLYSTKVSSTIAFDEVRSEVDMKGSGSAG
jgi:hypothetical protein